MVRFVKVLLFGIGVALVALIVKKRKHGDRIVSVQPLLSRLRSCGL